MWDKEHTSFTFNQFAEFGVWEEQSEEARTGTSGACDTPNGTLDYMLTSLPWSRK